MAAFDGFLPVDFDAFAEAKWASNAHNLERLEVKLKLNQLGRQLQLELGQVLGGQEMGVTKERPSIFNQHKARDLTLFFYRDEQSRKALSVILDKAKSIADNVLDPAPHHKHIVLGLRVDADGVQAGIFLHRDAWVDWKNAVERCRGYGESDRLADLLKELPDAIRCGRGQGLSDSDSPACELGWQELVEGFSSAEPWTVIGELIPRDEPVLAGEGLLERITSVLRALLPLHGFIAWNRSNDFHELKDVIKEQQIKAQRKFSNLKIGDQARILKGLAAGRVGVVESIEKQGVVKVRMGLLVMSVQMDDLSKP